MTLQLVRVTPSLDPDDILQELISARGEIAAANRIMDKQNLALATAHAALLDAGATIAAAVQLIERGRR